jgi:hypothetical protein
MRSGLIAFAVAAAAMAPGAHAQLFKCKGPDGKIVYSDTRCDSGATTGALPPGVSNRAHDNEAKAAAEKAAAEKAAAERKAQAEALVKAAKDAGLVAPAAPPAPGAAPASAPSKPYELTGADRERLRGLEMDMSRSGAYAEQKRAAALEAQSIRSGREARMSADDRARRDSLTADLVSTDAKKRQHSLQELQSLYNR